MANTESIIFGNELTDTVCVLRNTELCGADEAEGHHTFPYTCNLFYILYSIVSYCYDRLKLLHFWEIKSDTLLQNGLEKVVIEKSEVVTPVLSAYTTVRYI